MKKNNLLLFLILLVPFNVNAVHEVIDARCTNSIKLSLRQEAQNVVYRLSQTENNNIISYTGYFYNKTDNLVLMDDNNNMYMDKIENLKPGSTFTISLYASNKTYCEGYKVLSKIINIPYYNPYFGTDLCVGNEKFSLCAENANITLTEEEFKKKLNDYKSNLKKEEEIEIEEEIVNENKQINLYDLLINYKYYILFVLVILLIILEIITVKRKKDRGIL